MAKSAQPVNSGRLIQYVNGIQGVTPGGQALVNLPLGCRVHRMIFYCVAVNYTAPTITLKNGGGTNATFTPTVVNGQITAWAVGGINTGYTNGTYSTTNGTLTITDATGVGAVAQIVVAAGICGAITLPGGAAYTAAAGGGTQGPIAANSMLGTIKQSVNGQIMRDVTADQILRMIVAKGYIPDYGSLPIDYTEPERNMLKSNSLTSWDLAGQSAFSLQFQVNSGITNPGLTGVIEYDYSRNGKMVGKTSTTPGTFTPILQPVSHHAFSQNLSIGRNDIVTLPISNPIGRLWVLGSTPGNIYQCEVIADGTKVLEATYINMATIYGRYGFQIGSVYQGQNGNNNNGWGGGVPQSGNAISATNALTPMTIPNGALSGAPWIAANGVFPFDFAFISDIDGRPWKALRIAQSLVVRLWSSATQAATIVMESYPGRYS